MDNPQQLARTAAIAAWINAALGLVLTILIHICDKTVPVAVIPALIWCVLGLGFAFFLTQLARRVRKHSLDAANRKLAYVLITTEMAWVAGLVALTGGLRSPVWVLFVTVAVFVADVVERKGLAGFAAMALGMLLAASLRVRHLQPRRTPVVDRGGSNHPASRRLRRDSEDGDPPRTSRPTPTSGRRIVGLAGQGRRG